MESVAETNRRRRDKALLEFDLLLGIKSALHSDLVMDRFVEAIVNIGKMEEKLRVLQGIVMNMEADRRLSGDDERSEDGD